MQRQHLLAGATLVALLLLAGLGLNWRWQGSGDVVAASGAAAAPASLQVEPLRITTASGVREFAVEVARTPEQQSKGLMFRTELADNKGMLFPHDVPRELSMWMRNTYIPLDMLFIRTDGTVHRIAERTEPLSEKVIASQGEVKAVLELAGGAAERLGIRAGDRVEHAEFSK
jgi:uncharacterized membrane protein (UPF0127 family)